MDTKRMQQLANLIKEIEDESSIQTATELRKILHEEVDGMVDELIHQYGEDLEFDNGVMGYKNKEEALNDFAEAIKN
jgi:hypothetical protein